MEKLTSRAKQKRRVTDTTQSLAMVSPWSSKEIHALQTHLLNWFQRHQRKLPWRQTRDAYAILVSESMLQQTQVVTVVPYFERWLKKFPTWQALADATIEEVLKAWEGLGYYQRARNLQKAAQKVCEIFEGKLPRSYEKILSLPGIGPYTAGAVASIAFGQSVPAMDGNVMRVWSRLTNDPSRIDQVSTKTKFWFLLQKLIPEKQAGNFNQALMELGATICLPARPNCKICPVSTLCHADSPENLPVNAKRVPTSKVTENVVICRNKGKVFLSAVQNEKRWQGLWKLPKATFFQGKPLLKLSYSITRYRVQMRVFKATDQQGEEGRWFKENQLEIIAMPAPHRRALKQVLALNES